METIDEFPLEFLYLRGFVARIYIAGIIHDSTQNVDFFIEMKDGSIYAFTAFTPENIRFFMNRDKVATYVSPGLILVSNIDKNSILQAAEQCLQYHVDSNHNIGSFGVIQK